MPSTNVQLETYSFFLFFKSAEKHNESDGASLMQFAGPQ